MTVLNFPSTPSNGDLFSAADRTWRWNSGTGRWEMAGRTFPYKLTVPEIQGYGGSSQNRLTLRSDSFVYIETRASDDDSNPGRIVISAYGGALVLPGFTGNFTWAGNLIWHAGNDGAGSGLDADLLDGLDLHTGRNNEANKVVRTNASGYAPFGYINSNVGAETSVASHYWYMNGSDGYFRPKTLANVQAEVVTEAAVKAALANSADLQDTNELLLKQNCNIRASGGGAGTLYSTDVRDSTTAAAANVYIDPTGGFLQRSTSSRRYKKNIRAAKFGLGEVMKLRPVTYQGKGKLDGDKVHGGLIAEEVHAAGLPEFVVYRDGAPESLAYGNMVALLVKAVQEQQALIQSLQGQIDDLRKRPA